MAVSLRHNPPPSLNTKFEPFGQKPVTTQSAPAMAKEKSANKEERKREKHGKREKRSDKDGVHKSKKDKKEKREKKTAANVGENVDVTTTLLNSLDEQTSEGMLRKEGEEKEVKVKSAPLLGALVPFANPLADEKTQKKILKSVKKGTSLSSTFPPFFFLWRPMSNRCSANTLLTSFHSLRFPSGEKQISKTRRERSRQITAEISARQQCPKDCHRRRRHHR